MTKEIDKEKHLMRTLERLRELNQEREKLFEDLYRSVALNHLWPKAFNGGKCITWLEGNYNNIKKMRLNIENGKGEQESWPIHEVPRIILEFQIKVNQHLRGTIGNAILKHYDKMAEAQKRKEQNETTPGTPEEDASPKPEGV